MAEITVHDLLSWEHRISLPQTSQLSDPWLSTEQLLELEVSWAVTLRASMPILPPLRGGEVVILPDRILLDTGVPVSEIVREVASRGATGLIVERFVPTPPQMVTLWADSIPPDLESDINRMLTEQRGEVYRAGTELGRLLTRANALGASVGEVLEAAAAYLGFGAAVVSPRDGIIASAGRTMSDAVIDDRESLVSGQGWFGDVYAYRISRGAVLWLGPVEASRRALARLISERVGMAVDAAMAHAADVRPRGDARAQALGGLLTESGTDVTRIGAALGLPSNGEYAVALSSAGTSSQAKVARELAALGAPHDAATIDGFSATLIELTNRLTRYPRGSGAAIRGKQVDSDHDHWIVVSEPVTGVANIPFAARQARYLAALVSSGLLHGGQVHFDRPADVGVYRLLFPLWGSAELETFARDTLGQLQTRDRRGNLRKTLLAYLEAGGSQIEAAARLNIHRNTLSYRLRQITELTGTDPTKPQSHLALHMALLASVLPPAPPLINGHRSRP